LQLAIEATSTAPNKAEACSKPDDGRWPLTIWMLDLEWWGAMMVWIRSTLKLFQLGASWDLSVVIGAHCSQKCQGNWFQGGNSVVQMQGSSTLTHDGDANANEGMGLLSWLEPPLDTSVIPLVGGDSTPVTTLLKPVGWAVHELSNMIITAPGWLLWSGCTANAASTHHLAHFKSFALSFVMFEHFTSSNNLVQSPSLGSWIWCMTLLSQVECWVFLSWKQTIH